MIEELLKRGAKKVIAADVQDSSINAAKAAFADDIKVIFARARVCVFRALVSWLGKKLVT